MALIEIEHLTKVFDSDKQSLVALDDVSLSIEKGSIYGIIGMSGAGKSTLVRCINFLERPTKGKVLIDGRDLGGLTPAKLREERFKIGMIFQHFNLLMQSSVLENVMLPLLLRGVKKEDARKKAISLLEIVELSDKIDKYPSQLSGGQKQRVAIARTMSTDPQILLCDEATSALDPKTTESILNLLQKINREYGITIVIITHEMGIVEKICTDVAILSNSKLAESGKVEEVFTNPQSEVGKNLILSGKGKNQPEQTIGNKSVRIVFDGTSPYEPIIADLVLETGCKINILYADTAEVLGKIKGHMVVQLPESVESEQKVLNFLDKKQLYYQEV